MYNNYHHTTERDAVTQYILGFKVEGINAVGSDVLKIMGDSSDQVLHCNGIIR